MEIKAADVKALRDKTGAGMMECKKALAETNGDPAAAEKLLKEKGLVTKKIGRLKVLADGELEKPLTIKAESFSGQAIQKIRLADGTVIILRD